MRLNKPTLHINRPLASPLLRNMHTVDGAHAVTNLLSLPDTPGDTYLGQVFSAYVRATNMHDTPVKNVKVTVEMHTPTARVSLKDKRATGTGQSQQGQGPPPRNQKLSLGKDEGCDICTDHLLTELDTHRLQVTVSYSHRKTGEPCEIVKLYPVRVLRPINVTLRSREQHLDDGSHRIFVECALTNMTSQTIVLHSVKFIATPQFEAVDTARHNRAELHCNYPGQEFAENKDVLAIANKEDDPERPFLKPNDVHQYLFLIRRKAKGHLDPATPESKRGIKPVAGKPQELGRVLMTWRTCMGESARLQTAPVTFPSAASKEVNLIVEHIPNEVAVGEVFKGSFKVLNNSSRNLSLKIEWDRETDFESEGSICCAGQASEVLGTLKPNENRICQASFVALEKGLHSLSDAVVVDVTSGKTYRFKDVCTVFVQ